MFGIEQLSNEFANFIARRLFHVGQLQCDEQQLSISRVSKMLHQSENPVMLSHLRLIKRNPSYIYVQDTWYITYTNKAATVAATAAAMNGHQINYTENLSPERQLLSQIELH